MADPEGRTTTYGYNSSGYLTSMRMPGASVDTVGITYVPSSTKVALIVVGGQTWNYAYNSGNTVVTDPLGHTRTVTFDPSSLLVSADRNENGWTTSYAYCVSGDTNCPVNLLKKVTRPEGDATAFEYDPRGNVTKTTLLPKGGATSPSLVTSATYAASCANVKTCNQPLTTTDATSQVTNYAYDTNSGMVSTVTSPAPGGGVTTRPEVRTTFVALQAWVKNSSGSLVLAPAATVYPLQVSTCKSGDATGGCIGTANETVTAIAYEPSGTPCSGCGTNVLVGGVTVRSGNSDPAQTRTIAVTHDTIGNVTSQSDGASNVSQMRYNKARQMTAGWTPDPDGGGARRPRAVQIQYLSNGLPGTISQGTINSDGNGFTDLLHRIIGYDAYGRVVRDQISGTNADYSLTQTSYDVLGRVDCVAMRMDPATYPSLPASACTLTTATPSDPNKLDRVTKYTWEFASGLDHTTSGYGTPIAAPDASYTHDTDGQVVTAADGKGNITAYSYDGLERLIRTCYNPGTSVAAATTACNANTAPDKTQLTYGTSGTGTGRVITRGLRGHPDTIFIQYTYDARGRVTKTDYPGPGFFDQDVSYTYDNLDRLTKALDDNTHQAYFAYDALGQLVTQGDSLSARTMQYDGAGRRTRLTWDPGFYVTYEYDPTGAMTAIRENGSTLLASFGYDDLGRRTSLMRGNGVYTGYTYAGPWLSQLWIDINGTSADNTISLSYNAAGQITSRVASNAAYAWNGHYNLDRSYTTNALNQYTKSGSVTPTYDVKGNLTQTDSAFYTYDTKNELITSSAGPQLYYDPLGRMDTVLNGSPSRGEQYDGANVVAEFDTTSHAILRRFVFGPGDDEPIVWYEGAGTTDKRYLSADERGSVVAVTDAGANPLAINTYDEYGITATSNTTYLSPFLYTGQMWLPEIGMYNYKARIYSPTLGRFMQTDPIGYGDGINWYNYAGGDPVNGSDPSGLDGTTQQRSGPCDHPGGCSNEGGYAVSDTIVVNGSRELSPGVSAATYPSLLSSTPVGSDDRREIVVTGAKLKKPKPQNGIPAGPAAPPIAIQPSIFQPGGLWSDTSDLLQDASFKKTCYNLIIGVLCIITNEERNEPPRLPPKPRPGYENRPSPLPSPPPGPPPPPAPPVVPRPAPPRLPPYPPV